MFGRLLNWLPIILKSVVLVEAISGLDGPSKKDKAMGLTLGFLSIMSENITDESKVQIGGMINNTVTLLNEHGIFETTQPATDEEIETDLDEEIEETETQTESKTKKKATKKKG
jgi:hypothetical protein